MKSSSTSQHWEGIVTYFLKHFQWLNLTEWASLSAVCLDPASDTTLSAWRWWSAPDERPPELRSKSDRRVRWQDKHGGVPPESWGDFSFFLLWEAAGLFFFHPEACCSAPCRPRAAAHQHSWWLSVRCFYAFCEKGHNYQWECSRLNGGENAPAIKPNCTSAVRNSHLQCYDLSLTRLIKRSRWCCGPLLHFPR